MDFETMRETTNREVNKVTTWNYANANQYPQTGSFTSLRSVQCKLHLQEYTYSTFRAELSRLLGEKNPCCYNYSGAGTWDLYVGLQSSVWPCRASISSIHSFLSGTPAQFWDQQLVTFKGSRGRKWPLEMLWVGGNIALCSLGGMQNS